MTVYQATSFCRVGDVVKGNHPSFTVEGRTDRDAIIAMQRHLLGSIGACDDLLLRCDEAGKCQFVSDK